MSKPSSENKQTDFETKYSTQSIDDLLASPFDQESTPSHYLDQDFIHERQWTNEKTIDRLPEHRQAQARDLAKQIDEKEMSAITAYGSNAQKKLSEFSHQMLHQIKLTDVGEVGEILTDLMLELNQSDPSELTQEQNFLQRVFNRAKLSMTQTQMKYQELSNQIDKIAIRLDREKNDLLNDNLMLDQLYQKNQDYYDALNIYIAAGELKMEELQKELIPEAIDSAKVSNHQMDIQVVHDLNQFLDRLDKRVHDLRLTRQMTMQQAPQIRMIQNTNQALAEKIQVSVHTAIPLWENQVMIALALLRQQDAIQTQQKVADTTNELLRRNASMLQQGATDTAREVERGIIDLETLQDTQTMLVDTITETLTIQKEGRQHRRQAEAELLKMEDELRNRLLTIAHERNQEALDQGEERDF